MTPEDQAFARSFIAGARWQVAASVPEAPHAYSLDRWNDQAEFERFVRIVAEHGYRERWRDGWTYTYLEVDELRYWASPAVHGEGWIVNRARIKADPQLSLDER